MKFTSSIAQTSKGNYQTNSHRRISGTRFHHNTCASLRLRLRRAGLHHGCGCTPATAKALASRFSSSRIVAGRLAEAQLHWHTNRAKNLSRDQFAVSHEVTNEQQLSRCNDPVQREIRE